MELIPVLAAISGNALVWALIWIVIAAVVFFLLNWFIGYVGIGEPFLKIAKVIIAIVVLVLVLNALFTIVGKPFISW